jgi:hypothetical protein
LWVPGSAGRLYDTCGSYDTVWWVGVKGKQGNDCDDTD